MRKMFFAAAIAAMATSAAQADTAIGQIAEVNPATETVTLTDGRTFDFKNSNQAYCLSGFLPGETVRIDYSEMGGALKGRLIKDTKEFQTIGRIASVDTTNDQVTLENGLTFKFDARGVKARYKNFNVGDEVRIAYNPFVDIGGVLEGLSIGNTASRELAGTVKEVNVGAGTITLEDGVTYEFDGPVTGECTVGGFLPGDDVILILRADGEGKTYEAILPSS
jgi:opacity protein-like surface antigen